MDRMNNWSRFERCLIRATILEPSEIQEDRGVRSSLWGVGITESQAEAWGEDTERSRAQLAGEEVWSKIILNWWSSIMGMTVAFGGEEHRLCPVNQYPPSPQRRH